MSNNSPLLLILNKISILLFISLVGKNIYIYYQGFSFQQLLSIFTHQPKKPWALIFFPSFGHFLEGKDMFLSITPEWIYRIEAACVFVIANIWMKGKRNGVFGQIIISLQKEAPRVMSPSTPLISLLATPTLPHPLAPQATHRHTDTWEDRRADGINLPLGPPPPPQCRGQRAGGGEGHERMSRIQLWFFYLLKNVF